MTKTQHDALIQKIVLRAQRAIRRDVRAGVVPRSAKSLAALAKYVDANMYFLTRFGNLSRELDALSVSAGNGTRDIQPMLDVLHAASKKVNAWLRAGGAQTA